MSTRPWDQDGDTPAPWKVEANDWCILVTDANGGLVADCTDGHESDNGWIMADKAHNVARLIAAAPELLAALEEALEFAEDQEDVVDGPDGMPQANDAMRLAQTLRDAIFKATGEQV
jgi:hypothetical protein